MTLYLVRSMTELHDTSREIQKNGWLLNGVRHTMWKRRAEIEKNIFEWIRRFDIRVLGLPLERGGIMLTAAAGDKSQLPVVVRSNNRLQEFLALAPNAKQTRVKDMLLKTPDKLAAMVTRRGDVSFQPLHYGDEEIIFTSRRVSLNTILGTTDFQSIMSGIGNLAAALNCLDPATDIRLLKVDYYFYHADSNQFLFAHKPP
jgi:hypothetical protein